MGGTASKDSQAEFWRLEVVEEAASYIRGRLPAHFPEPEIGVICGSGCGTIADAVTDQHIFHFKDIPHFIPALVPGHKGKFSISYYMPIFFHIINRNILIRRLVTSIVKCFILNSYHN